MASFQNEIDNCLSFIKGGKIILYPTDTVWGIGCNALNESAVDKIFEIKQRPRQKSLIMLLSEVSELSNYTSRLTDFMLQQIGSFTTPTTVVLSEARNLPQNVINEDGSVAIRITKDPFCKSIIDAFGKPIISTSANISGADTPAIFKQIAAEIINAVDYVTTYRQEDEAIVAPSRIVRFDQNGKIVYLR